MKYVTAALDATHSSAAQASRTLNIHRKLLFLVLWPARSFLERLLDGSSGLSFGGWSIATNEERKQGCWVDMLTVGKQPQEAGGSDKIHNFTLWLLAPTTKPSAPPPRGHVSVRPPQEEC